MLGRRLRVSSNRILIASAIPIASVAMLECATSTTTGTFETSASGSNGTGPVSNGSGGAGLNSGVGGGSGGSDSGRPPRCNEAGVCSCFNIASLGYGGATGAQAGHGGTDNTQAFINYINTQSSATAAYLGCGSDTGCNSPQKPTLSADFLSQYDVLIFQWMTDSIAPVTMNGQSDGFTGDPALGGGGYWSFGNDELSALKTWVQGGGGVIVLSGYDYCPGNTGCTSGSPAELGPTNQIVQALTDMQYTQTDTFGTTETGNAEFCLGDSDPVTGWMASPDLLGENITKVGAFHGRGIMAGGGTVDCSNSIFGTCAAHENVGKGGVYVYTDEWVTYTSQWAPTMQPATYCSLDGSTANGDFPAVEIAYQVPQFWYNAIAYASQATMCPFTLAGTIPR
ncbi:MAG TPA: hypothetical protein VEK07_17860 [Polyangiaceae bacterium]|nr:hypothetical protein [Polyangiaceae bacterium]